MALDETEQHLFSASSDKAEFPIQIPFPAIVQPEAYERIQAARLPKSEAFLTWSAGAGM